MGSGDIHYYHAYINNNKYLIIFVIFIHKLHTVRVAWSFTTRGVNCVFGFMVYLLEMI
jgi:hypothetical protein